MRLRRETGDFQIRINPSNGTNAIRTGLSAEDFAGELININGTIEPVLSVSESEGVVTAKTASYTVTYNKATGVITSSEGGAGGSESGSIGIEVITLTGDKDPDNAEIWVDKTAEELTEMLSKGILVRFYDSRNEYGFALTPYIYALSMPQMGEDGDIIGLAVTPHKVSGNWQTLFPLARIYTNDVAPYVVFDEARMA